MDVAPPPSLRFLTGPDAGHMVLLEKERTVLGRAESADVTIGGGGASREHAAITRAGAGWRLEDLKSRNGTMLNGGELKAPTELKAGDRIRIGTVDLEFDVTATPAAGTRLELVEGPGAPRAIALSGTVAAIGRGCAIDIGTEAEAAEHAQLSLRGGAWRLRANLGCSTYLNGDHLVAEVRLKTGDRIRIGRCALDFVDGRIDDLGGQTIEDCTLATRIGAGTLGVVYRARDAAGKEVAIKLLDPGLREDPGAVARFVAGARAQMRISHPNVVAIRAVSQATTLPAAVMEWMPGGALLAERLAKGEKFAPDRCLAMAKDIANALAAAEELRVSHQGLRPANILFDAEGAAALSDFSLCAPWDPLMPSEGGDPRWIAPEEAGGAAADVRSNQFSVGLILVHALTAKPPYGAGSRSDLAAARTAGGLPSLRSLVPDAPPALERLLARLLARDPQHRFATWTEARAHIDLAISGREREIALPVGDSALGTKRPSAVLAAAPRPRSEPATRPPSSAATPAAENEARRPTERLRAGSSVRTVSKPQGLGRELGIPSSAWAGIGILVLMLVAIIGFSSMKGERRPADADESRREPPKPASTTARAVQPAQTTPPTPTPAAPLAGPATPTPPEALPAVDGSGPAPALAPRVLVASWIGDKADQGIASLALDDQGRVTATGTAFTATIDPVTGTAAIHGAPAVPGARIDARPRASMQPRTIDCDGVQVAAATRQVGPQLQLPALSGPGWSWWSGDAGDAISRGLGADARLDEVVPVAGGRFIALCWAEAANSVLARDPRDADRANTALPQVPDGPATWLILGDARTGEPLKALTLPGPPCAHAVDPWGRIYLSTCARGRDDLGMGGRAGIAIVAPDLSLALDARLGGLESGAAGIETFTAIAYRDGVLALGGTTAARELATRNPLQARAGGGQDALLVILRLWEHKPATR